VSFESALDTAIRVLRQRRMRKAMVSPQLRAGTKEEMEHAATIKKIKANPKIPVKKAAELIARDQLRKDPHVYDAAVETKKQRGLKAPRIKLLMRLGKIRVYLVNATAVRKMTDKNPDAPDYTMASHWGVWPTIVSRNEIWVSDELGPPRDPLEMRLTILHESAEARRMTRDGLSYDDAHDESLVLEDKYRRAKGRGLLAALKREAQLWGR
jgi:hypothetical protein